MERHATAGKRVYAKSVSGVRIPLTPLIKSRKLLSLRDFLFLLCTSILCIFCAMVSYFWPG